MPAEPVFITKEVAHRQTCTTLCCPLSITFQFQHISVVCVAGLIATGGHDNLILVFCLDSLGMEITSFFENYLTCISQFNLDV